MCLRCISYTLLGYLFPKLDFPQKSSWSCPLESPHTNTGFPTASIAVLASIDVVSIYSTTFINNEGNPPSPLSMLYSPSSSASLPSIPATFVALCASSTSTLSFLLSSISHLPPDRNPDASVWGRKSREPSSAHIMSPSSPLPSGEEIEASGWWGKGGSLPSLPTTSPLSPAQPSMSWPWVSRGLPRPSA